MPLLPVAHVCCVASAQLRKKLNEYPGFNVTRKVEDWKQFIQDSEFHLCPRGYGPTSYRLYECLQSETIPIYVWAKARTTPINTHMLNRV